MTARLLSIHPGMVAAQVLPGLESGIWQVRHQRDRAAVALADRHYSRKRKGSGRVGAPGRHLVLVTPCERAVWVTSWPYIARTMDGLDAWRCLIFRREPGAPQASDLILAAMDLTASLWADRPRDGWVTWIDTRKVRSVNPGYCYKQAGWWLDRDWTHRYLVRLRAKVEP